MQPEASPNPVRVRGDLDPALSRWQWIVKWLLAIPHYVVLFFLHIAQAVVTVIAFFAILITGRYPRALFDFSVGVLRWTWRVQFYAWSALGTDRYPPFSLRSDDNYPADLEIDYPERLHRGLVLIKWWLLAIPHYLIVSALVGAYWSSDDGPSTVPLLFVLTLIAAIALLFTGRYPAGLFAFNVGINRWILRVRAYTSLLRDDYPPFRLDQGPREPEIATRPPGHESFH
ncbi:DUF4389 domain-containing protein [Nocardia vermiculata]|uniref:DUF4389 domain-containing protein n=1 Tax=Nocardia vermiculata TaxID=257274 RepID=A0A846XUW3_9NOCA|nr:DUF4389 domain-containing protein [Nocardia vermiculata]NKY50923.1 DUF4389 domain-containing protein [Nocardia vermiculata]